MKNKKITKISLTKEEIDRFKGLTFSFPITNMRIPCVDYNGRYYFKDEEDHFSQTVKKVEPVSKTDELVQKMHILQKKLKIAVDALEWYAQPDHLAQEALKQIKEVK